MKFYKETNLKETEIGKIPKDWKIVELKEVTERITDNMTKEKIKASPKKEYVLYSIPAYHAQQKPELIKSEKIGSTKFFVKFGDVLFGRINPKVPKVWLVEHDFALASTEFIVLRPNKNKTVSRFVYYLLQTNRMFKLSIAMGKGAVPSRLRTDIRSFMRIKIPLPSLSEQKKVAEVLSCVDLAIEKVDKAIARAERLKKGLMQHLLTKGIGHKEFKQTPIGKIPKDWEIVKVKELGEVVTGTTPSTSVKEYWNGKCPFVTPADFTENKYVYRTERTVTEKGVKKGRLIPKDSVLVVCIGSTLGKVAMAHRECITNQQINAIICNNKANPHYVYYIMDLKKDELRSWAGITAKPIVKKSLFENFMIPLPYLSEQQKIAEILSSIDKILQLKREKKEKLVRMKRRLMDLLLTGRVRVSV